eukprot:COSAG02_NODE_3658_length_6408_cov_19.754636_3_plen_257_part_00
MYTVLIEGGESECQLPTHASLRPRCTLRRSRAIVPVVGLTDVMSSATQHRPDVGAAEAGAAAASGGTADEQVAASAGTRELGAAEEHCAWLFAHFDADKDGVLNRLEYKEFLKSIDVWGRSDAYLVRRTSPSSRCVLFLSGFVLRSLLLTKTPIYGSRYSDVYWAWTWRRICEQQAAPAEGLDLACFARRYAGPGRRVMLATDVERVRSARAAARERRPSETVRVWLSRPLRSLLAALTNRMSWRRCWRSTVPRDT